MSESNQASDEFRSLCIGHLAHSEKLFGKDQTLADHLTNVASLAWSFGTDSGIEMAAYQAGLLHDLGKATREFQDYVKGRRTRSIDHKGFGAAFALRQKSFEIAFAVAGHHGGLPNWAELQDKCREEVGEWVLPHAAHYAQLLQKLKTLPQELELALDEKTIESMRDGSVFDLRVRMLLSCLVDADFLDCEQHRGEVDRDQFAFQSLSDLHKKFVEERYNFLKKVAGESNSELNQLRNKLYDEALRKADSDSGVFNLTMPTGSGKTRTALGFALEHALRNNQKRIVVALPYTSILDQMAKVYTEIFGVDGFLLHYTGWEDIRFSEGNEENPRELRMRLASENWDASLVLTTTVQLFDSLFSNRPSKLRKVHNLARSVLILDEVQTLPVKYLEPICDMLALLTTSCGSSVVLSTATQPALDKVKSFKGSVKEIVPIIAQPQAAYKQLSRVKYETHLDSPWSWEQVAKELVNSDERGMVIVNTKKHALELYGIVLTLDESALHLSTYMCGAHRRKVIEEIKRRIEKEELCRVVSTQLVEAGVDLDFPLVMRAVGPLDRVVQAAGRCNREMKLGAGGGRVIVFEPEEDSMPQGEYKTAAGHFRVFLNSKRFHPDKPETFPAYFARLFQDVSLDTKNIQEDRMRLNFETVAAKFHMIEDGTTRTVFVGYRPDFGRHMWRGSPASKLLSELRETIGSTKRRIYRRLQPYSIEVFQNEFDKLKRQGIIVEDEATGEFFWWGEYDDRIGIGSPRSDINNSIV